MIPTDLEPRARMIKLFIDTIMKQWQNSTKELTEWEHNFIESIYDQFERKGNLSDKQCEILERIYDK